MKDSFSSYNPIINFTFFIGAIILGMFFIHPVYLAASVVLSAVYLVTIKGAKSFKTIAALCVVFVVVSLINPLFNTRGDTVLFTYFNRPYTLEALFYGMSTGAMLVSVLLWFASYNEVMTSDKFLYIFGTSIPSLSLILTMVLRLVPSYERKATQIASARKCVGKAGDAGEKREKIDNGLTVLSALTSWALEGAIVTADSMRSRGYGTAKRTSFSIYRFEARDKLLTLTMFLLIAAVITAASQGSTSASYIPNAVIAKIDNGYSVIGVASYTGFLSIPTLLNIKEALTWKYLRNNRISA